MFGINGWEMIVLAIIALLVFGPDRLPKAAADAGRLFRQVRAMIANARRDLSESLGPEFRDFDISDLNPRQLVRKHLLEPADDTDGENANADGRHGGSGRSAGEGSGSAGRGGRGTPYDSDAT